MSNTKIPEVKADIAADQLQKIKNLTAIRKSLPADITINFCDKNEDGFLNDGEYFSYETNLVETVYYSVKKGDTPQSIANKFKTTVTNLIENNNLKIKKGSPIIRADGFLKITRPALIQQSETKKLSIESSVVPNVGKEGSLAAPETKGKIHIIKAGETLSSIARRYNTTVENLIKLNPGLNPNKISKGTPVKISGTASFKFFDSNVSDSDYKKALESVFNVKINRDGKEIQSVLQGHESKILEVAKENDIPVAELVAIIMHESGKGTSDKIITINNPAGLMTKGKFMKFDTLDDGIEATAKRLRERYYQKGLTTLDKIQPKYCPLNDPNDTRGVNKNWLENTKKIRNQFLEKLNERKIENTSK